MQRMFLLSLVMIVCLTTLKTQPVKKELSKIYQVTSEKINDLIHTKLEAKFDYAKSQLNGKVWITLKPHFYATDTLMLDAKGMDINQVAITKMGKNSPLTYQYNGMVLRIKLDRTYSQKEKYIIYIAYTAKPEEYTGKGSAAITDAKGLYFINPLGEIKDKPTQIWTQGETEATSVWIPTIDKPNQKTTQEFYMTVPEQYVTLSNGILVSQKKNSDGTRTDYWKMDLPHAPYLFFMGVGDYAIIKDKYKNKEVSYYVEKKYALVARKIFGNTPAMIALFSKLTGVDYPWVKYAQIVGRDYVSGAMENTTATLHQESAQQDARELTDGNRWENVISHELFHQWFGDYTTTESWSNITLNESFATLGSQLWNEFHYGKDAGDAERYGSVQGYLGSRSENKDLVRFSYNDKEDVFDAVSYNKGGAILQMLRNHVGDSAFFKSLNVFLTSNKFTSVEAHQLRLAFEEVTGKDMNWFWNQWYFGSGHPNLTITYSYETASKQARVIVEQTTDKIFKLPVKIAVWNGASMVSYPVWVSNKLDTFLFPVSQQPDLINFDADKILVTLKKENKTMEAYLFQQKHAGNYADRREAIEAASKNKDKNTAAESILMNALQDPYGPLRLLAINSIDLTNESFKNTAEAKFFMMAQNDDSRLVRAAAIAKLGNLKAQKYIALFKSSSNDSSYSVAGNALEALNKIDTSAAFAIAKQLSSIPAKGKLGAVLKAIISSRENVSSGNTVQSFQDLPFGQAKFQALQGVFEFIQATSSLEDLKKGVDAILLFETQLPESLRDQVVPALNAALREIQNDKTANGIKDQADYIESKLPKDDKKGF